MLSVALGLGQAACIDTDLDPTAVVDCSAASDALQNVVFISANLWPYGIIRCSGVLVTRTLIVTSLGCAMVPTELADVYGRPASSERDRSGDLYYAYAADTEDCNAGTAIEDGSFATLFGNPLPKEVFDVYLASERVNTDGHKVSEVLRVDATRCSTGLALLRLASGIGPNPIPVRSTATEGVEEPLILSYLSVASRFTLERNDVPVAPSVAEVAGRPRSFELSQTCPEQGGAALVSAATGALVGVLASSLGKDCLTQAQGTAVALAAFRRTLIDAAAPERLLVESGVAASNVGCDTP